MLRYLILPVFSVSLLLASCAGGSRVQTLTKSTQDALEEIRAEAQRAIRLTAAKVKSNEVDPEIGKTLIENLKSAEQKVTEQVAKAAEVNKENSREAQIKFADESVLIIKSALTDIKTLHDLYDVGTFSQFETATFFPSGGYAIPVDKMTEAKAFVEPVVQRIIKFIGEHPTQRFVAVIVCYGYSDETPVGKELHESLLEKIDLPNPTRQDINRKLSELRAKTIAKLLVDVIKSNESLIPNPKLINYDIKWVGRGETLPYPEKIKDYTANDKRRRLVSLIWNVLPGSLYLKNISNASSSTN